MPTLNETSTRNTKVNFIEITHDMNEEETADALMRNVLNSVVSGEYDGVTNAAELAEEVVGALWDEFRVDMSDEQLNEIAEGLWAKRKEIVNGPAGEIDGMEWDGEAYMPVSMWDDESRAKRENDIDNDIRKSAEQMREYGEEWALAKAIEWHFGYWLDVLEGNGEMQGARDRDWRWLSETVISAVNKHYGEK